MSVHPAVTHALARRQGWRCIWCEFAMAADQRSASYLVRRECPVQARELFHKGLLPITLHRAKRMVRVSFEHLVPQSLGGPDLADNGLAACCWCNEFRGTEEPLLFKARVVALLAAGQHPRQIFRASGRWPSTFPARPTVILEALAS